jgi:hypothetical protein
VYERNGINDSWKKRESISKKFPNPIQAKSAFYLKREKIDEKRNPMLIVRVMITNVSQQTKESQKERKKETGKVNVMISSI